MLMYMCVVLVSRGKEGDRKEREIEDFSEREVGFEVSPCSDVSPPRMKTTHRAS